jgi:hypothetical protein
VSNHGCVSKSTCLVVTVKEGCERVDRLRNRSLLELFIAPLRRCVARRISEYKFSNESPFESPNDKRECVASM